MGFCVREVILFVYGYIGDKFVLEWVGESFILKYSGFGILYKVRLDLFYINIGGVDVSRMKDGGDWMWE